jgi:hypothetical protein
VQQKRASRNQFFERKSEQENAMKLRAKWPVAVIAAVALLGCERAHESWDTHTGTSADGMARALPFVSPNTQPGQFPVSPGYALTGCLSGSNEHFTLTDANTGTIYRIQGNPDQLKLHVGELISLAGERSGNAGGVPWFKMTQLQTQAVSCPVSAQGGTNELNQPPSEKVGIAQMEVLPNPQNVRGQPSLPASATRR